MFAGIKDLFVLPTNLDHVAICLISETMALRSDPRNASTKQFAKSSMMLLQLYHCLTAAAELLLTRIYPRNAALEQM
jgi:hypothetical protein